MWRVQCISPDFKLVSDLLGENKVIFVSVLWLTAQNLILNRIPSKNISTVLLNV